MELTDMVFHNNTGNTNTDEYVMFLTRECAHAQ